MRPSLETIAQRLHADVMAPLVLGGPLRPGRVIGARAALALAALETPCHDVELDRRVQAGRLRQVRKLVPIDTLGPASGAEWTLAAALNDLLQCANPTLDRALRRGAAARILDRAAATIDRVRPPASAFEAVSRHSWLARVLDIERRDTRVSWWVGTRTFLGVEPSRRLLAWPNLRRVKVEVASHSWALLAPPAVRHERLTIALGRLLERTPLTDIATCARAAPPFAWSSTTLAFVATRAGRTLALRALAACPRREWTRRSAEPRAMRSLAGQKPLRPRWNCSLSVPLLERKRGGRRHARQRTRRAPFRCRTRTPHLRASSERQPRGVPWSPSSRFGPKPSDVAC